MYDILKKNTLDAASFFKGVQYLTEAKKKIERMDEANEEGASKIGTFFIEAVWTGQYLYILYEIAPKMSIQNAKITAFRSEIIFEL